ncbi:MAG: MmcQ/YjbR family DNA-binding protein [Sporolactobacillus sp.]
MAYEWINDYCLLKKGVNKDFKTEWNALRYSIGGKMFAMQGGDKIGKPIFTLKLAPELGDSLRREYSDIVPGYYMNKTHWNSLYLEGDVPDNIVRFMIDRSYEVVFNSLPKKIQKQITD